MPKPKVFINKINKEIKNNKGIYHYKKDNNMRNIDIINDIDIKSRINELFNSEDFVYKIKVNIRLVDGKKITKEIIALKDNSLITINSDKISIDDIIDIKKAN